MNDEVQDLLNADKETERFVAAIYADRRQAAEDSSSE
jgi:hypothetical protein